MDSKFPLFLGFGVGVVWMYGTVGGREGLVGCMLAGSVQYVVYGPMHVRQTSGIRC